jgi:bile acid:Na+ symporter, BASS family
MGTFTKIAQTITKLFPLWVIVISLIAFFYPSLFRPYVKAIPYLLSIVMLAMGLTMSFHDFKLVFSRPKDVFWGIFLRFLIMPLVALCVSKAMGLSPELAAGLILVGCCPSGVASNVMTFLARGDTALSVTVSSANTIVATILTPYIFLLLAGKLVPINAEALLWDIVFTVLIAVLLGMIINTFAAKYVARIRPAIPVVSVLGVMGLIAILVAVNAARFMSVALVAFIAVVLHNGFGLLLGFWGARLFGGMSVDKSKAIAFEIGIENSGLALALAMAHLNPIAAIPAGIFAVWHNLTGAALASYWGSKAAKGERLQMEGTTAAEGVTDSKNVKQSDA